MDAARDTREPMFSRLRSEADNATICVTSGKLEGGNFRGNGSFAKVPGCSPFKKIVVLGNAGGVS